MMTGRRPLIEVVKRDMRSLLLTAGPEGYTMEQLDREHRYLNPGCTIPVKELNFISLEELLRSMPDVARLTLVDGELRAIAVANEETRHIESLQNASRPRRRQSPDTSRPFHLIDLTKSPSNPSTRAPPPHQPRSGPVLSYSQSSALPSLSSIAASRPHQNQNQSANVTASTASVSAFASQELKPYVGTGSNTMPTIPATAASTCARTIAIPSLVSTSIAPVRPLGPEFRQMIAQVLVDPSFPEDGLPGADFMEFFQCASFLFSGLGQLIQHN